MTTTLSLIPADPIVLARAHIIAHATGTALADLALVSNERERSASAPYIVLAEAGELRPGTLRVYSPARVTVMAIGTTRAPGRRPVPTRSLALSTSLHRHATRSQARRALPGRCCR